eukprot:4248255-Alexandrium_andersonii.AAC.1
MEADAVLFYPTAYRKGTAAPWSLSANTQTMDSADIWLFHDVSNRMSGSGDGLVMGRGMAIHVQ